MYILNFYVISFDLYATATIQEEKVFKVEYHENALENSEKIAYVGQRLMYPIIKKMMPYHANLSLNAITFLDFYIKNSSF